MPPIPKLRGLGSTVLALALIGPGAALADEAQARALFKAMSDYLGAQTSLSFDFDSSLEVVTTEDQKLTLSSSGSVAAERPGKLRATRKGGFASVEAVFDGSTLMLTNHDAKTFARIAATGTLADLADKLSAETGLVLPAADLLAADLEGRLAADATDVKDLGSGVIGGQECDHIAFRSENADWQVWIAQGDAPHPCRFQVTSRQVTGWPDYTITFSNWGKGSVAAEFTVAAPEGATEVDLKALPDFDELAGIYVVKGAN